MAGPGGGETLTASQRACPSLMTTLADPSAKLLLSVQLTSHAEKAMTVMLVLNASKSSLSITLTASKIEYSLPWCYKLKRGDYLRVACWEASRTAHRARGRAGHTGLHNIQLSFSWHA